MEKFNYDFDPIKQKILMEAHRLVDTYHIDTGRHCIRDLCELEEYVHRLKTYPGNDHDFITMHLGKYSCQFWERGYCNFGFDGATEEEFIENFLMHLFFRHCRSCYKGHYLCIDLPGNKERDGQICCTDVLTGHQCYGSTSAEAEAAMKAYIDQKNNHASEY